MELKYNIEFLSYWHCGSGLSGGAETDADVNKDKREMPYIPGKTIKGLLRHALIEINEIKGQLYSDSLIDIFGNIDNTGKAFFTNATLHETEYTEIINNGLTEGLYSNIASTKINDRAIATHGSLRVMEVCVPLTLHGTIEGLTENQKNIIEMTMKWVRTLGMNRNRGLGKCIFKITTL